MSRTMDLKTLAIGLLLGACLMMARGNAAAADGNGGGHRACDALAHQRYQISASARGDLPTGIRVFVLDHVTNRVACYSLSMNGKRWDREESFQLPATKQDCQTAD